MHTYRNWKMNKISEHQAWTSLQILQGDPYMQQHNIFTFHYFILMPFNKNSALQLSRLRSVGPS